MAGGEEGSPPEGEEKKEAPGGWERLPDGQVELPGEAEERTPPIGGDEELSASAGEVPPAGIPGAQAEEPPAEALPLPGEGGLGGEPPPIEGEQPPAGLVEQAPGTAGEGVSGIAGKEVPPAGAEVSPEGGAQPAAPVGEKEETPEKEGKAGLIGGLLAKFAAQEKFCAGIYINPESLRAVLLSPGKGRVVVETLETVPLGGEGTTTRLEAMRRAVRELNKKMKLKRAELYLSLSADQVAFKFFLFPGLSGEQIRQAVEQQLKTDKKWNPSAWYLDFASVGMMGGKTRVIATYVARGVVQSLVTLFGSLGCQVYVVEPDIVSLHRALAFTGIVREGRTVAVVNAEAKTGRVSMFTRAGVTLSRTIGRMRPRLGEGTETGGGIPEEGGGEEAGGDAGLRGEEFQIDVAREELVTTFDYYEYSLIGVRPEAVVLMGDPSLTEVMREQIPDALGVDIEPLAIDVGLNEKIVDEYDSVVYGVSVGCALGGVPGAGGEAG